MHRRCCWPPDRLRPSSCSLSLTSSHIAASRSASSTRSPSSLREMRRDEAQAERDVVEDRHGKGRRLLEHHADAEAQRGHIHRRREDVLAVEPHLARRAVPGVQRVHAVEHPQQRRLAAARRADERGDPPVGERQVDVLERLRGAVVEIEVLHLELHAPGLTLARRRRAQRDVRAALTISACPPGIERATPPGARRCSAAGCWR